MKSYLRRQSKESLTALGLASVVVLEAIDSISGSHMSFVALYLLLIWFVTYFAGTGQGVLMSLVSAVPWLVVDLHSPVVHSQHIVPYLNGTVRLEFFLIIVLLTSTLRHRNGHFEGTATEHSATIKAQLAQSKQAEQEPVGNQILSTY